MVVALPAGGAVDALARVMAEHMKSTLGPADHRGEHGGARRHAFYYRARGASPPDGYTLGMETLAIC